MFLGFPCGSAGKESTCNARDLDSTPGLGRSSAEGKGYPVQYSGPENSMGYIVHGVEKRRTRLSDFHFVVCGSPGDQAEGSGLTTVKSLLAGSSIGREWRLWSRE